MKHGPFQKRRPSKLRDGKEAVQRFEEEEREAVRTKVRLGIGDTQAARELHMDKRRFRALREALGLAPNHGGAE